MNELFERELINTSINDVSLADYVKENYVPMSVIEDIKAEIEDGLNACIDIIDNVKNGVYPQIYSNAQMEGRKITYKHCLEIIDKHCGKENE